MSGSDPERILLIGMMGAGKSTVGRTLAERLGWPYLDSDDEIKRRTGRSVPEIWRAEGEAAFRALESAVLDDAARSVEPVIIAVAGGAVLDPANRALIAGAGLVVWLRASTTTLIDRVGDGDGRPLLADDPAKAMRDLYTAREPIYSALANVTIDVDRLSPHEVADLILARRDEGVRL